MERDIYIDNIEVEQAKKKYFQKLNIKPDCHMIPVAKSVGCITYQAVYAKLSSPSYNAAAMDGILVKASKTYNAKEISPVTLEINKDFIYVNTGNLILDGYDAVIMVEDVMEIDPGTVQIIKPAYPWQHIRMIGEDIVATEMIVPSSHKIRPVDLGALIAGGINHVPAYKKPKVGILPTGSEIIDDFSLLGPGKIMDSNSYVFEGLVNECSAIPNRYHPLKDDYELLKNSISKAVNDNDILLIIAGSSAGTKDYTAKIIKELGKVIIHGIAMKPGKPIILGIINNKPVIGIPGYPVSAYLCFEEFVKPLILQYTNQKLIKKEKVKAVISRRIVSSLKNKEMIRVTLGKVGSRLIATPLIRGAGVTMSLVNADGILAIDQNIEGVEAGQEVNIELLRSMSDIENTLLSIGSHDLIMDVIADKMDLTSAHVGSMGGIMAMKRGENHIAPIHLLDIQTGKYNIFFVKKYFPTKKMALIKGVKRLQGFIVQNTNPKKILGFKDLTRDDVTFINRQRGAGTRLLLDYELQKLLIDPSVVSGYAREAATHMAVAIAVKSGSVTTGLGVMSAAKALDLDFIPFGHEEYDFLVPYEYIHDNRVQRFIEILKSKEFCEQVINLGGYEIDNIGQVIVVQ